MATRTEEAEDETLSKDICANESILQAASKVIEIVNSDGTKESRTISPDRSAASCARLLERLREQIKQPAIQGPGSELVKKAGNVGLLCIII